MSSLIDTHCHLADPAFAEVDEVVSRMDADDIIHAVVIGESPEAHQRALGLVDRFPGRLSATAGVHPHEAKRWDAGVAAWLAGALADPRVVAVGEMGLDYHYDYSPRDAQRTAFEAQLEIARAAAKPVIIHARSADDDMAGVLANHPGVVAVMHSFSSGPELLRRAIGLGHYISLSGMITFKSWQLDSALREVPVDRLLVETDAPYLAPVPHRGKRNEPAYVRATARRLAQVLAMDEETLAAALVANSIRVFGPRLSHH